MNDAPAELHDFRERAVAAAGGTSDGAIKTKIRQILVEIGARGRLLDLGAGRGELLDSLLGKDFELTGVDYLQRPAGLPVAIQWLQGDLNEVLELPTGFDVLVCSEAIEHLENPRRTFRLMASALKPSGALVLTMPNQESLRSYAALLMGGHFAGFLGNSYPAHITALLRVDLIRICEETGFDPPSFDYTDDGGVPKLPDLKWQALSFGLLKGRLFSDNLVMVTRKRA